MLVENMNTLGGDPSLQSLRSFQFSQGRLCLSFDASRLIFGLLGACWAKGERTESGGPLILANCKRSLLEAMAAGMCQWSDSSCNSIDHIDIPWYGFSVWPLPTKQFWIFDGCQVPVTLACTNLYPPFNGSCSLIVFVTSQFYILVVGCFGVYVFMFVLYMPVKFMICLRCLCCEGYPLLHFVASANPSSAASPCFWYFWLCIPLYCTRWPYPT